MMKHIDIGVNFYVHTIDAALVQKQVEIIRNAGFSCLEISLDGFPFIVGGKIFQPMVDYVKEALKDNPLPCSAHASGVLDLRKTGVSYEVHRSVLFSSIDVCAALDLSPLVLHFEKVSMHTEIERQFLDVHREAAEYAKEKNILLCIENIEVEKIDPVLQLIEKVDNPNLKMTLDVGHAYLASSFFGEDFFAVIKKSLPYLGHVHISGNTGTFEPMRIENRAVYDAMSIQSRITFGQGDIHLPPLWGNIPYDEVFSALKGFQGRIICEFPAFHFVPFLPQIYTELHDCIKKAWMEGSDVK